MLKNFVNSRNAAISRMAGTIAHEINNPLSIILGYSQMMLKMQEKGEVQEAVLEKAFSKISLHSKRINEMVKNMLIIAENQAFTSQDNELFSSLDFIEQVKDTR